MMQIQEMLLDMLREIDEVCAENDIQYFLDGGTCLGAVRHEGFIPWDNDADIIMTEDNYKKFVEVVNSRTAETHRMVADNRVNRDFGTAFGRYVNLDTTKITKNTAFWDPENADAGLIIDVFILFPLPKAEPARTDYMELIALYDEYQNFTFRHHARRTDRFIEGYKKAREDAKVKGQIAVLEEMEAKIFNQNLAEDEYDEYVYLSSPRMYLRTFPKQMFDSEPVRLPFESLMLPVTQYYLEELRMFYDDEYYLLPGMDDQKVHPEMHSPDIPYNYFVRDYMRFTTPEEMKEKHRAFKDAAVDEGFIRKVRDMDLADFVSNRVRANILEWVENENIDLTKELEEENWDLLTELFSEWERYQFSGVYKKWYLFIDLPDDILYVALMALIYGDGAYGKVSSYLLRYNAKYNRKLTPGLSKVQEFLDDIFAISSSRIYGRTDKWLQAIENAEAKYPRCREVRIERLKYDLTCSDNKDELLARAEELLTDYPGNADLIKTKGDILWESGDRDSAMAIYNDLYDNTNNGFIMLDIRKKREEMTC